MVATGEGKRIRVGVIGKNRNAVDRECATRKQEHKDLPLGLRWLVELTELNCNRATVDWRPIHAAGLTVVELDVSSKLGFNLIVDKIV